MLVLLSSVCQVIIFICLSSNYIDIQGTYSFYTSPALIRYIWYSKIPQSHYIDELKNKQLLNFYLILNSLETMISDWQVDKNGGFPGGQMVKTLPSNTGGVVRELRAHIPHHQKKKKKKKNATKQQMQYCNKFNKDFKNDPNFFEKIFKKG